MQNTEPLLSVQNLTVSYASDKRPPVVAVDDVSFDLRAGEFVGIVGESGSGKSTLGFAITRLAKPPARIEKGRILFDGADIAELSPEQVRRQRRGGFAMVLQAGMNALNPVRTVANHFTDIFRAHGHVPDKLRHARMVDLLEKVELSDRILKSYPGQLSGGMRQRVAIALALSLEPRLMVFDEPTTALDVLVQQAVMKTIQSLQRSEGFTAVLISHDLGTVLESAERVLVMSGGRIVEDGDSEQLLTNPQHPYTRMLLSHYADPRAEHISVPGLVVDATPSQTSASPDAHSGRVRVTNSIRLEGVSKEYRSGVRGAPFRAVDDVTLEIAPGQAIALVGQSGSGKSTIAKLITGIERPTSGTISFGDVRIDRLTNRRQLKRLYAKVQMVFQDPYAALNPLHPVEYIIGRPLKNFGGLNRAQVDQRTRELLETVELTPADEFLTKLPHQLSGGQRQRVVIARALASDPQVLIADEPVSMLDMSLRSGVLALLTRLRRERGVSLLYITHDLLSARLVTDEILVLNKGTVVESGATVDVLRNPQDDYTRRLLDAVPTPTGSRPS
ncbi:ABC transporter ATP-binding protein [Leifsonia poae]|uniref:ABC transporter ATP-binding protein n=1 Tax=Leifsonia poae TaxID=110933 RepID=UPI003D66F873